MGIVKLILLVIISLSSTPPVNAFKRCPNCGQTKVPYPLSTAPNCGHQSYKLRCTKGTLFFDSINGSSYAITAINPTTQRFILHPPSFSNDKCVSTDFPNGGIWLDANSPFNITSSNTVVLLNCSQDVFTTLWNCSSFSICHKYVKDNDLAAKVCETQNSVPQTCCHVKTGGSVTAHRIRVRKERCAAYVSFPNLDDSLPVRMWRPGVEIEWELPEEPPCRVNEDCLDLAKSSCSPDPVTGGVRKCMCKSGYGWDPVNGICQKMKCQHGRGCKRRNKKTSLIGGLAVSAGATLAGGTISALVFHLRRQRRKRENEDRARSILNAGNSSGRTAKIFSTKEITKATCNFSKSNLLGSGGFGEVFKGTLDDGTLTAIKRAKKGNTRGVDQILNEVSILCQVNHRSLVRLLGCCVDFPDPLLVYEYVPNGTLFDHLHNNTSNNVNPLGWYSRLRIAHQTAEGLSYLHNAAVPRIFHRDIKSSNILLDHNLDAKVSDFGLSRLVASEGSGTQTHITTCAKGTLGYLDPEYYLNFQLTDKSDVYSFGVVLLELLTSKKAIDFNREEEDVNLVVMIKRALKEGRLMEVVDPVVKSGGSRVELESVKAFGALAATCVDDRRQNRPSMKDVADEIEYILGILAHVKV